DAYRSTGNYEKATEYYNKALNIEFDIYAVLGLALISKNQGRFEEAIASLTRLKQSDPQNYRFYLDLADCYLKIGDKNKAIETLQEFQKFGIKNQAINDVLESIK
ncbi:MAG: tetratricopeptide repeat protein, partial [Spirochaetales bacterium]|nr:tetratricopeptide repeat protein [Spirochaetales bacterium]